ncbi:unnamed protein product [Gadus morhua 'NCC']
MRSVAALTTTTKTTTADIVSPSVSTINSQGPKVSHTSLEEVDRTAVLGSPDRLINSRQKHNKGVLLGLSDPALSAIFVVVRAPPPPSPTTPPSVFSACTQGSRRRSGYH